MFRRRSAEWLTPRVSTMSGNPRWGPIGRTQGSPRQSAQPNRTLWSLAHPLCTCGSTREMVDMFTTVQIDIGKGGSTRHKLTDADTRTWEDKEWDIDLSTAFRPSTFILPGARCIGHVGLSVSMPFPLDTQRIQLQTPRISHYSTPLTAAVLAFGQSHRSRGVHTWPHLL